jgi:hypothetical protein
MARRTKKGPKQVEALKHDEAKRKNIPTAELQSAAQRAEEINPFKPVTVADARGTALNGVGVNPMIGAVHHPRMSCVGALGD